MPDSALRNAQGRVNAIAARIAEIEQEIASLEAERVKLKVDAGHAEAFIAVWHTYRSLVATDLNVGAPTTSVSVGERAKPTNPAKEQVAAAVRTIIVRHGAPMSRKELLAALVADGFELQGNDPAAVLGTMLWRTRHIITHLKQHGYWPADIPYEPAGYVHGQVADGSALE